MPRRLLAHDGQLFTLALLCGVPGCAAAALLILGGDRIPFWLRLGLLGLAMGAAVWTAILLRRRARHPLHTLANLLAALREGDFSFRARLEHPDDALGQVYAEVNTLSELLQQQRLRALEATALLRAVMEEIDVAILAFDDQGALRLVNRAGAALLGKSQEALQGAAAEDLGLAGVLEERGTRLVDLSFPGRAGRFEVRRGAFRQGGRPHQLVVLSDLTRMLREEERRSWQRLVRVLGHEINNSLAPIQSLAESLVRIIEGRGEEWEQDTRQGLGIISSRAQGLGRFMEAYTRLAKLPEPRLGDVSVALLLRKVVGLESRLPVRLEPGPDLVLHADGDQLEQALINLVKNAVEASLEARGEVVVSWHVTPRALEVKVEDEGPGLPDGGNLFVPFFTTKQGGSGIGLVLSRQIAENHGGSLVLANREGRRGAQATLRLPR